MYFVYLIFRKICTVISSELLLEYFVYANFTLTRVYLQQHCVTDVLVDAI